MKKALIIGGIVVVVIAGLVAAVQLAPNSTAPTATNDTATLDNSTSESDDKLSESSNKAIALQAGRYEPYGEAKLTNEGYETSVIFFHAPWCPECRAFESAIQDSTIPDGVQILKVDYDSATELREQYGVTLQSTFVSVSPDGALLSKWVGYGQDKSVEAILSNL